MNRCTSVSIQNKSSNIHNEFSEKENIEIKNLNSIKTIKTKKAKKNNKENKVNKVNKENIENKALILDIDNKDKFKPTQNLKYEWYNIIINLNIEKVNDIFYNEMSYLIKDIYHNLKIDPKNVKNTIWNDKNKRSKTLFWKSTKNKSRNANITEIYIKKIPKKLYIIDEIFNCPDLYFGKIWNSITRRILIAQGENKTKMIVSGSIEFKKHTYLKGLIEKKFYKESLIKQKLTMQTITKYFKSNNIVVV